MITLFHLQIFLRGGIGFYMEWYLDVFKNRYADFQGRASLREYWMFTLFNVLVIIALYIFLEISDSSFIAMLFLIYALASIVPSLAVTVRRLHDIGKSGWTYLFSFIPIVGGIILLIFTCMEGQPNQNQYGPNPKLTSNDFSSKTAHQSSATKGNFCNNCGYRTPEGKFCAGCGNKLFV